MNLEHEATLVASEHQFGVHDRALVESPNIIAEQLSCAMRDLTKGLSLSALYGLALGSELGGSALFRHALGVPLGLVITMVVMAPALFVVLGLINAPVTATNIVAASARSLGTTGLVLAGVAPAAAMLVVTIEAQVASMRVAEAGFWLAGVIALVGFRAEVQGLLGAAPANLRSKANIALFTFSIIAVALAARVWSGLLPVFGGAA